MDSITTYQALISEGRVVEAVDGLRALLAAGCQQPDRAYYLIGNAYRKQGNWQQALNHYRLAIEANPSSPAVEARRMIIDILNFYHKDMYNQ